MIRRQYYLHLRKIPDFFSRAQRKHSTYFSVFSARSSSPKFVVVVPKKVTTSAVKRNNCKRQVYAFIEQLLTTSVLKKRYNVIVVKRKYLTLHPDEKKQALQFLRVQVCNNEKNSAG